jgi:hypothetical protein
LRIGEFDDAVGDGGAENECGEEDFLIHNRLFGRIKTMNVPSFDNSKFKIKK